MSHGWSWLSEAFFWQSVVPLVGLGGGFWTLYFDRWDDRNEPLDWLLSALVAGLGSAIAVQTLWLLVPTSEIVGWLSTATEEGAKAAAAWLMLRGLAGRLTTHSQGVVYGVVVGLGFAVGENMLYLAQTYGLGGYGDDFWLVWQGRFWVSSLIHALLTGVVGLALGGVLLRRRLWLVQSARVPSLDLNHRLRNVLLARGLRCLLRQSHATPMETVNTLWVEVLVFVTLVHWGLNWLLASGALFPTMGLTLAGLWWLGERSREEATA